MSITNYEAQRGDTFTLSLTIKDSNGAAQNIADWMFWMTLKTKKAFPDASAELQIEGSTISAESGTVAFTLPAASTALLLGTYYYDVEYKDSSDVIATILKGVISFLKDITIRTS